MKPKHIGLKPNLNIIIIFNDMEYGDVCERLKNCIVNVEELLKDVELISTEELSCLLVVLSVKLNERITKEELMEDVS